MENFMLCIFYHTHKNLQRERNVGLKGFALIFKSCIWSRFSTHSFHGCFIPHRELFSVGSVCLKLPWWTWLGQNPLVLLAAYIC